MAARGEQSRNEKYQRILNGAVKIFARHGYFNSKVSQIAREARVADGTIYLYFKNKEDILLHLFERSMEDIIQGLQEAMKDKPNAFAKLRAFVYYHFDLLQRESDLVEVITVELRQSAKFMKEYKNDKFREYLDVAAVVVKEGMDAGLIRPSIDPQIISRGLYGQLDELLLLQVLRSKKRLESPDLLAAVVTDQVLRGIALDPEAALRMSIDQSSTPA